MEMFGADAAFLYFCASKQNTMKQKDAIIEAMNQLGGRAKMGEICKRARLLGNFSGSRKPDATIRNCIYRNPLIFRPSQPEGWWELASYQEAIVTRDKRIKELEDENSQLKAIKTEDAFVKKMLKETKKRFKHESERNKAVAVSQILAWAGREDASENIDEWLEGKETPFIAVNGDYVISKHVDNEIDNIEAGGTGVNLTKEND